MNILTIRTDKPESEVGLYRDESQVDYVSWEAHRMLAETLNSKIEYILTQNSILLNSIEGIICYKGPGSFTGLRIGMSVANALAYALDIPIIGIENEQDWISRGFTLLNSSGNDKIILPEYGAPVHITQPKK